MMKDFTATEVRALSLDLRCCYFVQGWNLERSPAITTVDDWAEQIGWLAFYTNLDDTSREDDKRLAVMRAKEKVARVIAFVETFLVS